MKTKFLIFALALLSYTFVNGQDYYKDLDKKAKIQTEKMVTALDLTDNQQELIHRQNMVLFEQQARYDKLENATDEQKGYMESLEQDYIKNVTNTLTDGQRVAFTKWLEKSKLLKY